MSLTIKVLGDNEKAVLLSRYSDLEFTEVSREMRCGRCERVPIHHYFTNCQHVFCLNCKKLLEATKEPCPTCTGVIQQINVQSEDFERAVISLNAQCPNHKYGCCFLGNLQEISEHLKICKTTRESILPVEIKDKNTTTIFNAIFDLNEKMLQQENKVKSLEEIFTPLNNNKNQTNEKLDISDISFKAILSKLIEETVGNSSPVKTLENKVKAIESKMKQLETENKELKNKNVEYNQKFENFDGDIQKNTGSFTALNNNVVRLTGTINSIKNANSAQQINLKTFNETTKKIESKQEAFANKLKLMQYTIKNRIPSSSSSLQDFNAKLNVHNQHEIEVTAKLDTISQDILKINLQINEFQQNNLNNVEKIKETFGTATEDLKIKTENGSKNLELQNKKINNLDEVISNTQITLSEFRQFNAAFQQLNWTKKTLENLENKLQAQLTKQKSDLKSDIIGRWTKIYKIDSEHFESIESSLTQVQLRESEFLKLMKNLNEIDDANDIRKARLTLELYEMEQKLSLNTEKDKTYKYTCKIGEIGEKFKNGYEVLTSVIDLEPYGIGAEAKFECCSGYVRGQLRFKDIKNSGLPMHLKLPLRVLYVIKDKDDSGKDFIGTGSMRLEEPLAFNTFYYKGLVCYSTQHPSPLPPNRDGNSINIEIQFSSSAVPLPKQIASYDGVVYGYISSYNEEYSKFSINPYMYTSLNGYLVQVQMKPHSYHKFLDGNKIGLAVRVQFLTSETVKLAKGTFTHKMTVTFFSSKSSARNLVCFRVLKEIPASNEYALNVENEDDIRKLVDECDTLFYKVEIKNI